MYSVRGRSAATAVTANHAVFVLWNPHATQIVRLLSILLIAQGAAPGAGLDLLFIRTTTRGTPGSTVTPDLGNHAGRGVAPPSGLLLDLAAFTVQPATAGPELDGECISAQQGASCVRAFGRSGLAIPPGTGVGAYKSSGALVFPASEITAYWRE